MAKILVADDNSLSLDFFAESISRCGHVVDTARDGVEACVFASTQRYDLMIIDSRMPLRSGEDALRMIRAEAGPSRTTKAIASTADADIDPDPLLKAGFSEVLVKPISLTSLFSLIELHLPTAVKDSGILDDHPALAKVGGDPDIVAALRGLLAIELDSLPDEIQAFTADHDASALDDRLHRLAASAGFCGATRLADATGMLRRALERDGGWPHMAIRELLRASAEARARIG